MIDEIQYVSKDERRILGIMKIICSDKNINKRKAQETISNIQKQNLAFQVNVDFVLKVLSDECLLFPFETN
jgi:hypothetical protein